jgi:hypothetical protein
MLTCRIFLHVKNALNSVLYYVTGVLHARNLECTSPLPHQSLEGLADLLRDPLPNLKLLDSFESLVESLPLVNPLFNAYYMARARAQEHAFMPDINPKGNTTEQGTSCPMNTVINTMSGSI